MENLVESGNATRKPRWDVDGGGEGGVSAKQLVHFITGCRTREGRFVPHSDASINPKDQFPALSELRKVLGVIHPVLNEKPEKGGSPDSTLKGWMRHGRLYRGGTPASSGPGKAMTADRQAKVLAVVARVCGFKLPAPAAREVVKK